MVTFLILFVFICWYVLSSGFHKGWELAGLTGLEENLTSLRLVGHFLPKYIHSLVTASPESCPLSSKGRFCEQVIRMRVKVKRSKLS